MAVAVLVLLVGCQAPPAEMTEADRQAIADEIERLTLEQNQYTGREDMEAYMAYWSPSADDYFVTEPAVFAHGIRIIPTLQSMREFFDPSGWNRQSTNLMLRSSSVAVLSPEIAVQVRDEPWSVTNMEGETGPTYPSSVTVVWVKEDGAWKIMHAHQTWTNTPIEEETEG
jgi:hypothetical protein